MITNFGAFLQLIKYVFWGGQFSKVFAKSKYQPIGSIL
jgi:hypothetical protein